MSDKIEYIAEVLKRLKHGQQVVFNFPDEVGPKYVLMSEETLKDLIVRVRLGVRKKI